VHQSTWTVVLVLLAGALCMIAGAAAALGSRRG